MHLVIHRSRQAYTHRCIHTRRVFTTTYAPACNDVNGQEKNDNQEEDKKEKDMNPVQCKCVISMVFGR